MSVILPLSAAVLQAASFITDKIILSLKRITYKTYIGISFPMIFFITLIIFFIFDPPLSPSLFTGKLLIFLLLSSALAIATNLLFYQALDDDKVGELEIISLFGNIPAIIFTSLIFVSERNPLVISLAVLSSISVIWAHWKGHHFQIMKKTKLFLFWTLLIAPFGVPLTKSLLTAWNPISLELIRSGILALALSPFFIKYEKKASMKAFLLLLLTNLLTTIAWILYFFSFQKLGVIQTVLIFSIQPLLVYFASILFLKEKFHWKKFVSFAIILVSISVSIIF